MLWSQSGDGWVKQQKTATVLLNETKFFHAKTV